MADDKRTPVNRGEKSPPAERSSQAEIDAFLAQARAAVPAGDGRGRMIFALDATMSRQPTWDTALRLQSEMFEEAGRIGGLDVQLVYFRGFNECRASRWVSDARALRDLMTKIDCRGGHTQIGKDPRPTRATRPARRRSASSSSSATRSRRRSMRLPRRPANWACSGSASSSSRKAAIRSSNAASGDCATFRRRLCPFRYQCRWPARPIAAGRGGLRCRRPQGARQERRRRRSAADRADAIGTCPI